MNAYELATRFIGEIREFPGSAHHPFIQWAHMLCNLDPDSPDEVPWCSSFVNAVCWILRLPRSNSAAARSWLKVGTSVDFNDIRLGDVVVLRRGIGPQLGPEVLAAPGHVGFFAGYDVILGSILVVGGNQSDGVTIQSFKNDRILGIRRL